jgi:hypothetical protein
LVQIKRFMMFSREFNSVVKDITFSLYELEFELRTFHLFTLYIFELNHGHVTKLKKISESLHSFRFYKNSKN